MTVNLSKIVPGVPLQWQWCSLAQIKYLCWPELRMWDAVMNIIHLDYCTSTCHSIHIILVCTVYLNISVCLPAHYHDISHHQDFVNTPPHLIISMFCLLQTHKDRSPGCPPAPPRTRRTKQMRWVMIRWWYVWWCDDARDAEQKRHWGCVVTSKTNDGAAGWAWGSLGRTTLNIPLCGLPSGPHQNKCMVAPKQSCNWRG